jgi:hypothetical protein
MSDNNEMLAEVLYNAHMRKTLMAENPERGIIFTRFEYLSNDVKEHWRHWANMASGDLMMNGFTLKKHEVHL